MRCCCCGRLEAGGRAGPPPGPGGVRSVLPRHGRQSAGNGGGRPGGAAGCAASARPSTGAKRLYRKALTAPDEGLLAAALARNVFDGASGPEARTGSPPMYASRCASWPPRTGWRSPGADSLSRPRPWSRSRTRPGRMPATMSRALKPWRERPWNVPVALHEVPETGRHFELAADERTRAAIATLAGLRALPRLHAVFEVTPRGRDGLHVVGDGVGDRRADLRGHARADRERGRGSGRSRVRAAAGHRCGRTDERGDRGRRRARSR